MGNNRTKKRKSSGPNHITSARNKFMCFACLDGELDLSEFEMFQHKDLDVSLCDTCYDTHGAEKWHNTGDWNLRDENDKCQFCNICGEGGTLLPCDKCSLSYCTCCLKTWLGEDKLQQILDDDTFEFNCFMCLKNKKEECDSKFPEYKKFREATVKYGNYQVSVRSHQIEEDIKEDLKSVKKVKRFKCFSCFDVKDFTAKTELKKHAKFGTVTCDECHHQLTQDDWTYTEQGKSEYCVLTGTDQGGDELFVCDTEGCENVFCEIVLKHWLNKTEFSKIMEDDNADFYCFICDPEQGNYRKFMKESQKYLTAFDEDFKLSEESSSKMKKEEELRKRRSMEREERKSKSPKRNTRKRQLEHEKEESSDEDISAPKTRNINLNFKEDDSEIQSDPELDYVGMVNGDGSKMGEEAPPTEKEAAAYLLGRIESGAFNKKYHDTKAYQKILKFAKGL